jgi:RNA polymerase sigma factor (sigma-70 family)
MASRHFASLSLAALVALIAAGNVQEPWEEIDRRYRRRAVDAAFAVVRHVWPERSDEAADIAQEALVRAYCNLDRYDRSKSFWPWLRTIVKRRAIDRLRKSQRWRNARRGIHLLASSDEDVVDRAPLPEETLIGRECLQEARRRLREAVDCLTARERDLFLRFYAGDECVTSLAVDSRLARQTVRCILTRAKSKLTERLGSVRLTNRELKIVFNTV